MADDSTDILYIAYRRPEHVARSLPVLLETCGPDDRVRLWQNGTDAATIEVVERHRHHPAVHRYHHSPENQIVRGPTITGCGPKPPAPTSPRSTTMRSSRPVGYAAPRRIARTPSSGSSGAGGSRCGTPTPKSRRPRLVDLAGGHRLLRCLWVEGSGYLMKRACVEALGPLRPGESFTRYCIALARLGWVNGWYHPFLEQEDLTIPAWRTPSCGATRTSSGTTRSGPRSRASRPWTSGWRTVNRPPSTCCAPPSIPRLLRRARTGRGRCATT